MWKVSGIKIECTELRYFDEKVNILGKKGQQLFNIFFFGLTPMELLRTQYSEHIQGVF